MVDLGLGDIATGAAANLATDLVKATCNKLKVLTYGPEQERALERCLEEAFTDLLQTLVEARDRERLDSAISALRFAIVKGDIAEALIETALLGRLDRDWLRGRLTEAGLDGDTLPIDLDQALIRLVAGLEKALRREAAAAGSPLHGRVQLADLFHLRCELYRSRVVLQDLSAWIKRHTTHALRYGYALQNYFFEYLGLPTQQPRAFGGREDAIRYLNRWLGDPGQPNKLMLAAPSGRGKSALLVHWVRQLPEDWQVVFVPVSIRFGTAAERPFFPILAARLAEAHGDGDRPAPEKSDDAAYCRALAQEYLSRPLPDGRPLVLIIDGLDEAVGWTFDGGFFPMLHPPGLKIVVSARLLAGDTGPEQWIRRLNWDSYAGLVEPWTLTPLTRDGIADVLRRMGAPLADLASDPDVLDQLVRLTEGDPLLVRFYVKALTNPDHVPMLRPEDLTSLAPGYRGYFDKWLNDQRILWGGISPLDERARRMILTILSCAKGPLERSHIKNILKRCLPAFDGSIAEALRDFQRFVIGDGSSDHGYVLSHSKLAEYFHSSAFLEEDEISAVETAFLEWGQETLRALEEGKADPESVPPYLVQFFSVHLQERAPDKLMTLVTDGWRRAWYAFEAGYRGFAGDVATCFKRLGKLTDHDEADQRSVLVDKFRCALCLGSINSRGDNVPPKLIVEGVACQALTIRQALHLADLKGAGHSDNRTQVLVDLAPYLPDDERLSAIDEVRKLSIPENKVSYFATLAELFSGSQREALVREAQQIAVGGEPQKFAHPLSSVLRLLPHGERSGTAARIADAALSIVDGMARSATLANVIPHLLPDRAVEARSQAIDAARSVPELHRRAHALFDLAFKLGDDAMKPVLLREANTSARRAKEDVGPTHFAYDAIVGSIIVSQACSQAGLAQYAKNEISEKRRYEEASKIALSLSHDYYRVDALTKLLFFVPEPLRQDLLDETLKQARMLPSGNNRAHALAELVTFFPRSQQKEIVSEGLREGSLIEDQYGRCLTFIRIVEQTKGPVFDLAITHAERILRTMPHLGNRADALRSLAPHLNPSDRSTAYNTAFQYAIRCHPSFAVSDVIRLIPNIEVASRDEAISFVLQASKSRVCEHYDLIWLAEVVPTEMRRRILLEVFRSLRNGREPHERIYILLKLIALLEGRRRYKVISAARKAIEELQEPHLKVQALAFLSAFLDDAQRTRAHEEIKELVSSIEEENTKLSTLLHAVDVLSRPWCDQFASYAYATAKVARSAELRAKALARLAASLPSPDAQAAIAASFEAAKKVEDHQQRKEVLLAFRACASLLDDQQRVEALDMLLESCSRLKRSDVCNALEMFPALLSEEAQSQIIPAAIDILNEVAEWFP